MKIFNHVSTVLLSVSLLGLTAPVAVFAAGPAAVNLGSAANFAILTKTGISNTGSTAVIGDIGVSPAQATYITGFGLILPASSSFSTSAIVTGKVYAPGYADPTPSVLTTAVLDMQNAYTDAMGRAPTATEQGAGNIGGLTLAPGVYKWGTGVTIPTDVTLSGAAGDVWIFQIAQGLNVSSAAKVVLSGGAQPGNVYWAVGGQTTIGTGATFNGNILDQTAIVLNTGARLYGRALAQTAVTLDANYVATPSGASVNTNTNTYANTNTTVIPPVNTNVYTNPVNYSNQNVTPNVYQNPVVTPVVNLTPNQTVVVACPAGYPSTTTCTASAAPVVVTHPTSIPCPAGYPLGAICTATPPGIMNANIVLSPTPISNQPIKTLVMDLSKGSKNSDVGVLQQFLISQNKGPAARALVVVGVTSYFGTLTQSALAEFQTQTGIIPALGNFGPITRGYIGSHY